MRPGVGAVRNEAADHITHLGRQDGRLTARMLSPGDRRPRCLDRLSKGRIEDGKVHGNGHYLS